MPPLELPPRVAESLELTLIARHRKSFQRSLRLFGAATGVSFRCSGGAAFPRNVQRPVQGFSWGMLSISASDLYSTGTCAGSRAVETCPSLFPEHGNYLLRFFSTTSEKSCNERLLCKLSLQVLRRTRTWRCLGRCTRLVDGSWLSFLQLLPDVLRSSSCGAKLPTHTLQFEKALASGTVKCWWDVGLEDGLRIYSHGQRSFYFRPQKSN